MPNKKGSKVAASKARAQAMAKKKARHGGPALAAAAYVPPPPAAEGATTETGGAVGEAAPSSQAGPEAGAASVAIAAPPLTAPPARALRGFSRERAHQAPPALSVSLRREVGLIGALTVAVVLVLVALQLFTGLGG
ncbi:MAG: hypothetical protein IIC94_01985 [Chloroflexi bacterium]|nr:hypothetical protein [Chloroflexota bacterium]